MASSGNSNTAVHVSMIILVMISIVLGVLAYLKGNEAAELRKSSTDKANEARKNKEEWDKAAEELRATKSKIGYPQQTPAAGQGGKDTTIAQIDADLKAYGDSNATTLKAALFQKLLEIDKLKRDLKAAQASFDDSKTKLEQEKKTLYDSIHSTQKDANNRAIGYVEKLKEEAAKVLKIETDAKKAIAEWKTLYDKSQTDFNAMRKAKDDADAAHKEQVARFEKEVKTLQQTVAQQLQKIDDLQKVSFERADGFVRQVDHSTKLVWINLGSEDRLPDRLTFSVYSQSHHGIARGHQDIKGSIEITRIIGPHMAEARILKNDIYNPIHAGDPIYTPLWSPGVTESFAFSGIMDVDGDGKGDRDLLHSILKAAGAKISNEVDDNGVRHGTGLTNADKFLVLGTIPDPQEAADVKERERRKKLSEQHEKIETEAKNNGVRVIRLADFLAYIGFKADRRLWRPGELSKRKLKAGAASASVNQTVGRRQSSGQTSGLYNKRGRVRQATSTGRTSKLFGGK
jgi:hypothetical protein